MLAPIHTFAPAPDSSGATVLAPVALPRVALPAVALPALNGRSVRNLSHVRTVHRVRLAVAITTALFGIVLGAGYGIPAYAQATTPVAAPQPHPQSLVVSAAVQPAAVVRDNYTVTDPPPLQWPLAAGTPISDGFGPRVSPCSGCSSEHEGVDFDPGYGAQVHSIAAGVVVETNSAGSSALGVHVSIQHLIDGAAVTSVYGHMQVGSMKLRVGDAVTVGQVIGLVGSTGASTGAHLHFEIHVGGRTAINPLPWMHARLG